jgi:hypothetical protein
MKGMNYHFGVEIDLSEAVSDSKHSADQGDGDGYGELNSFELWLFY